jgi:hypothetical protein
MFNRSSAKQAQIVLSVTPSCLSTSDKLLKISKSIVDSNKSSAISSRI